MARLNVLVCMLAVLAGSGLAFGKIVIEIDNPSFEDDALNVMGANPTNIPHWIQHVNGPWQLNDANGVDLDSFGSDGIFSVRLSTLSDNSEFRLGDYNRLEQMVMIPNNAELTLDVYNASTSYVKAQVLVDTQLIGTYEVIDTGDPVWETRKYDLSNFASANENDTKAIQIQLYVSRTSFSGQFASVSFDNIALQGDPIPEPVSVSMLALGGIALMRRRIRRA